MFVDVCVNLMSLSYDEDRDGVVEAAAAAGVSPLVITGSCERSSLGAALYAGEYNVRKPGSLYTTAGVHPHEVKNCGDNTIGLLRELALEKGARAIGECGLDYNRDFSPRDEQRSWFLKQAELAAELSLPLFLHVRDAFEDFSAILSDFAKKVPAAVVHCFTGTGDELEHYLSLGCYVGITGWICDERRGNHLRELVKIIPSDRLLLETDSPFLLPRDLPFKVKSRRNEPSHLPHIAQTVASCLGKDTAVLARETFDNAVRVFRLNITN